MKRTFLLTASAIAMFTGVSWYAYAQTSECQQVIISPIDGTKVQAECVPVAPVNDPPVAVDDTASGLSLTDITGNVLANDTDPQGSATLQVVQPNADIAADGSFTVTYGSPGTRTISYQVTDGEFTDTGVLTVTVDNRPPEATDDAATVLVGQTASGNVLANDTDADDGVLSVTNQTGDVTIAPDGSWSFSSSTAGEFTTSYTLSDGQGGSHSAVLTVTVNPPANQNPVAADDTNNGLVGQAVTGNVLTNDSDPESQTLSVVQPSASIINADGSYSFTETSPGTYSFDYTVSDGNGGTDTGILTITITQEQTQGILSFPGADGAGRFAQGGRGGSVIQVTNLMDSGTGSLRACMEASGPRTCVFRVSGNIGLDSPIEVIHPYLTVAGETAPGQGITIFNDANVRDATIVRSHDVIFRHIRYRTKHPPHNVSPNGRNLMIGDIIGQNEVYNVMVDHSSFSWASDQPFDISPANVPNTVPSPVSRVTLQESLVYEGLRSHSKGPNLRSCGISIIRSMIASNTIRNPNNTCGKWNPGGLRSGGGVTGETEFRNNVVYNGGEAFFDMWDGRGEAWTNIVGNVFKKGPNSTAKLSSVTHNIYPIDAWTFAGRTVKSGTCAQNGGGNCSPDADALHIYMDDNIALSGAGKSFPTDGIDGVLNPNDAHLLNPAPVGDGVFEDGVLGPIMPASQVFAYVSENAGAFPNNRDAADARIINDANNGTGSIPFCTQSSTSTTCDMAPALPALAGGVPYADSDADGMSDQYETSTGRTNANADHDGDGWTNLEEFLHELAAQK